jgi:hypothetical protein
VLIEERVGPHLVHVEAFTRDGNRMYRAMQIVGKTQSMIGVSARSAEDALVQAARCLGYELVKEEGKA